jgi:hypothetical protein
VRRTAQEERMKKTILCLGLVAFLAVSFAACKKKAEKPATGETAAGGDISKFDDGYAAFREAIRFVSLTPNKEKAAEAAGRAEECFADVAKGWPTQPPERFEGDNDWANRISSLTKTWSARTTSPTPKPASLKLRNS